MSLPKKTSKFKEQDLLRLLISLIKKHKKRRIKLPEINTIADCVELIKRSSKIMVLTGAGVSVSCGIPDFRSENGIYSRLSEFDLNDPQEMFCLNHFISNPECFYSFAKEIYPSNFKPSPSHNFIKLLEERGKLLRNYTQNIDTLEQAAGIKNVIQCHGSFTTASCIRCRYTFPGDYIEKNIFDKKVPECPLCQDSEKSDESDATTNSNVPGILKPDIVFFGEGLPESYGKFLTQDYSQTDLLIVMGTSLKVLPVSDIPSFLPKKIPAILINRTPNTSVDFDVQLVGYSDAVVLELCRRLEWELPTETVSGTEKALEALKDNTPKHWHIFPGAQLIQQPESSDDTDSSLVSNSSSASSAQEHTKTVDTETLNIPSSSTIVSLAEKPHIPESTNNKPILLNQNPVYAASPLKRKASSPLNNLHSYFNPTRLAKSTEESTEDFKAPVSTPEKLAHDT